MGSNPGYADILKQLCDSESEQQLRERVELAEQDKRNAVEVAETKVASESQKAAAAKDSEIEELKARLVIHRYQMSGSREIVSEIRADYL